MSARFSIVSKFIPAVALCVTTMLSLAGCGGGDTTTAPPPATPPPGAAAATPIAKCVDEKNNVIVGGPHAKKDCNNVLMSPSSDNPKQFDEVQINDGGALTVAGNANGDAQTPVQEICIMNGGAVSFGTKTAPITSKNKVLLQFIGTRNVTGPLLCPSDFSKGIVVMSGATLQMFGTKGVPTRGGVSWTTLAAPAGSQVASAKVKSTGLKTLKLTDDVTKGEGWAAGDWIVVATTTYTPFESEFVQITSVKSGGKSGGSTITLAQPLKYYHFGSLAPSPATKTCPAPFGLGKDQPEFLCDGANRNWGVDERAEVGLISRDIELSAATEAVTIVPPPVTSSAHWGGEIMIEQSFSQVAIQGVRLSKFGKDQLGSYPIHFHMIGSIGQSPNPPDQSALIDADSIDHSYNKCVTIHNTANLTMSNLVCARIVGHIFYQELDRTAEAADANIVYKHNLGLGAMSNSFDIYPAMLFDNTQLTRQQMIDRYWWTGDYMTNADCTTYKTCIGYDGFNISDTDDWNQPTHGACYTPGDKGKWVGGGPPPCQKKVQPYYIEPASGFWIQNPGTVLTDNSIAGCQGDGIAYWWVTPRELVTIGGKLIDLRLNPVGKVENDRASACYHAYFAEDENNVSAGQLSPILNGADKSADDAPNIITHFEGLTATHNRWRALWLRGAANWYVVKNGHFADNNRGATLLTSGGIDGNGPGVWELLEDSAFVGLSQNNVGRWGPCPKTEIFGTDTGFDLGCIDYSFPSRGTAHSGEIDGKGYPGPDRNSYGYQIYDGPALLRHLRFVNYNTNTDSDSEINCNGPNASPDPKTCAFSFELTRADRLALHDWQGNNSSKYKRYEGDAALGWFPNNQSAYPTASASRELMWVNSNFRHQVFTERVNLGQFNDADKNTAIIDEDGTLAGFGVQLAADSGSAPVHAISLNNLPFNSISNSVDECFSGGELDMAQEGRQSALMSPATMATLEFSNLYPWLPDTGPGIKVFPGGASTHWADANFTRDDAVPDGEGGSFQPSMLMQTGRNGLGVWEPKVTNGYGYTVMVKPTTSPSVPPDMVTHKAGIWKWIEVGLADVVDPNITATHPFFIQLGINYTNVDGSHPANNFTITRGYKSYRGGVFWPSDPELKQYWTDLPCFNLDAQNPNNVPWSGNNDTPNCPAGTTTTLTKVTSISGLTTDGSPNLGVYYYNETTGYLYLNVAQDEPNAIGPSPTGSCSKTYDDKKPDPACPDFKHGEAYYVCPKNGCIVYAIETKDPNYNPGTSVGAPSAADAKAPPVNQNQLVVYGTQTVITRIEKQDNQGVPYYTATNATECTATQPPEQ